MLKRTVSAVFAALFLMLALSACGADRSVAPIDASEITEVTATDALYSSYLYVIEDQEAIAALCELYNSLTYRELADGEEAPDLMAGTLYTLCFHDTKKEQTMAVCDISPAGYLLLGDVEHPYRLTSNFDEAYLVQLLETYNTSQ